MRVAWLNDELSRVRVTRGTWFRKTAGLTMSGRTRRVVLPWDEDPTEVPVWVYDVTGRDAPDDLCGSIYVSRNNELARRVRAERQRQGARDWQPARRTVLPTAVAKERRG